MSSIKAISVSDRKGVRKNNVPAVNLIAGFGLENDAHGGRWHRQVSLLAQESIDTMRAKGLDVVAGNFAENLTTEGLDLATLPVGQHLAIGDTELVVSQLGKICHVRCAIYHQAGDCVMPRQGIFAVVKKGGPIAVGDRIRMFDKISRAAAIIGSKESEKIHGDRLQQLVSEKFLPAFVRYDALSDKEGGTFPAILKDLTTTQRISTIVVFDPQGSLGLHLSGWRRREDSASCYLCEASTIYYCRSLEEVEGLIA